MTKNKQHQKMSPQTLEDSLKVAKATQRPGQTKEQTKLIAQGIQKGIDQYKKQHKAKSRELNKKLHKASKQSVNSNDNSQTKTELNIVYKQALLPWVLLFISWLSFIVYFFYII